MIQNYMYVTFVAIIFFILGAWYLDFYGRQKKDLNSYDAIVVLGCKLKSSGEISSGLQGRIDLAVSMFQQGYAPIIIFTGGATTHSVSEAGVAKKYVVEKFALPVDQILLEEQSRTTEENAFYARELYKDIENILIVTDSFHVYRGEKVFEKYFTNVESVGRVPKRTTRMFGSFREVLAVIKYKAVGDI
jgi:uncharacterized SAM-binding protein YcdF (DUF218 family)